MRFFRTTKLATKFTMWLVGCATYGCHGDGTFFDAIADGGMDSRVAGAGGAGGVVGGVGGAGDAGGFGGSGGLPISDAHIDVQTIDPTWISPFPNTGAPGFRDSRETLCSPTVGLVPIDVWSDAHNVFALVTTSSPLPIDIDAGADHILCPGACKGLSLYRHDGTGWSLQSVFNAVSESVAPALTGTVDGRLLISRAQVVSLPHEDNCTLVSLMGDNVVCGAINQRVRDVFSVSAQRAFATMNTTLLQFDGVAWTVDARLLPRAPRGLWADASNVIVASYEALHRLNDSGWDTQNVPFIDVTAIWASASDDIWLGNRVGEVWRFDGQAWQRMTTLGGVTCGNPDPVQGIWGSEDTVYFHGARSLQRWNGNTLENLANWSCAGNSDGVTIDSLWGNAPDEVFIGLSDQRPAVDSCDRSVVMHFDGTLFHRM